MSPACHVYLRDTVVHIQPAFLSSLVLFSFLPLFPHFILCLNRRRVGIMRQMLEYYDYSEEVEQDEENPSEETNIQVHTSYDDEDDLFVFLDSNPDFSSNHKLQPPQLLSLYVVPCHEKSHKRCTQVCPAMHVILDMDFCIDHFLFCLSHFIKLI